jgi:ribA/ribD-fused uncharacterized protein
MKGKNTKMINDFHGENFFLSNFFELPFWYKGRRWKTVEHAFQAAKCLNWADEEKIHKADTPGEAKRIGRKVTLIPGWDYKRVDVMRDCLRMKFLQNDDLMQKLLSTGDEQLVEGNTWHDNYWGECSCEKCSGKIGTNMLGQLLMELRDNYRKGNFIWVARDLHNGGEIVEYYKTREKAVSMIENEYKRHGEKMDNPYECNGYRLDVICMKD